MDEEVIGNGKRIRKERYRKFKDDWRYVGCDVWRLDKVSGHYSPEVDWIAEVLEEREAKIIYDFVWRGRSMDEIGKELGYTRQRIWQLYKQGLARIGEIVGDAEQFKALFIMDQPQAKPEVDEDSDKESNNTFVNIA